MDERIHARVVVDARNTFVLRKILRRIAFDYFKEPGPSQMTARSSAPCHLTNLPKCLGIVVVLYSVYLYGVWTCHQRTVHFLTPLMRKERPRNASLEYSEPCIKLPTYCHQPHLNIRWPLFKLGNPLLSGRQWCDSVSPSEGVSFSNLLASFTKQHKTAKSKIPLIYINMNTSWARRVYILNTFMNEFENIVRQPAITVTHPHVKELMKVAPNVADPKKLAVLSSHWHAIQLAKKLTSESEIPPYALILEDDAWPLYRAFWREESIDKYAIQLPDGWEVVQLGLTRAMAGDSPIPTYHWQAYSRYNITRRYDNSGPDWGAFAYLISRKGMEKVLSQNLKLLHKHCPSMTADDCLLGFTSFRPFHSPFDKNVQFTAHPPLFGVLLDFNTTHHRQGPTKEWHFNVATAGNCMSLFENTLFTREKETPMVDNGVRYNIDLVGNDLRKGISTTFSQCKTECIRDPMCGGLTFGIPSECYLKTIGVKYDQLLPLSKRVIGLISVVMRTK